MENPFDTVQRLTSAEHSTQVTRVLLNDFAYALGWHPSDRLDVPSISDIATTHLVIEHGLENAAVISFLRSPWTSLNSLQKRQLLGVSYNNLVDWHIQIQSDKVEFVYNRNNSFESIATRPISEVNFDSLRKTTFEQIIGKKPNPNLPALDEALIKTISRWKRNLAVELNYAVENDELSALFNAIIFVRALEDHYRRFTPVGHVLEMRTLGSIWRDAENNITFQEALRQSVLYRSEKQIPAGAINDEKLQVFDNLDRQTIGALISDFYHSANVPYEYDFSIMSKHALSRIYEHYVSILRPDESPQLMLSFLPRLPEETWEKSYGSIYTPQFIARFFARYLREQMAPPAFRRIRSIDPACGSGIFLRSLLEIQCDPTQDGVRTEHIIEAFQNICGIDIDENASQAARLSLSLLHLVLTDDFPPNPQIVTADAIGYFEQNLEMKATFDAVLANPPFVPWDAQNLATRQNITRFMSPFAKGKMDLYLAFLVLGIEMLKPGGYALFVLPHNFLLGANAKQVRKLVTQACWIRCLADLTAIRIFEDSGSYVVLLILQKKVDSEQEVPPAMIIKCQDMVNQALQDAVEGRYTENSSYSIYNVPQSNFGSESWAILPAIQEAIERRLETFPTIDQFLQVRTGFITGADDIFVIERSQAPQDAPSLFVPLLRDREMRVYNVPESTSSMVFYPYLDGVKIDEPRLIRDFPETWAYLNEHRVKLEGRKSIVKYGRAWWEPMWARPPENLMRPKLVSPHLSVVPRFSIDVEGKYAVSHAPLLYPKNSKSGTEEDLLKFFLAVLNSTPCYWYISTHSHVYGGGYSKLEPITLKKTPVPDPSKVPPDVLQLVLNLVDRRLEATGSTAKKIEDELDDVVAQMYGLTASERRAVGLEY